MSCGGCSGCADGGLDPSSTGASDHKVKVTGADTTPDFLSPKILAGTGITTVVINPGANEQLQINASAVAGTLLHFDYYVDNLGAAGDGTIGTPFNDLQTAIDFAVLTSTNWTIYLADSAVSYGNIVWTLNGGNCRFVGMSGSNGVSGVVIGDVTYHTINPGQSGVSFENLTVGNILDVSAALNVNLSMTAAGYASLVGSDFTILEVSNIGPKGAILIASTTPSCGNTSAVLFSTVINGFCTQAFDAIDSGVAYNTTFQVVPTSSINAWELHACKFTDPAQILSTISIDSETEKQAMIAGLFMDIVGISGLSVGQNSAVGLQDADTAVDFTAATRLVATQTCLSADRFVDIANTGARTQQVFKIHDWHAAHTISVRYSGVVIATLGPNTPGEGFEYIFQVSQAFGNPVVYQWVSEL